MQESIQAQNEDHPRLCGEKLAGFQGRHQTKGSPPPMRGKAKTKAELQNEIRITPAYAGKSSFSPICILSIVGSPPPMRGKASSGAATWNGFRITPAYAGKSLLVVGYPLPTGDHPRLCGEKPEPPPDTFSTKGSPPPMRGKVHAVGYAENFQ